MDENIFKLKNVSVFKCENNDFDIKRINLSDVNLEILENEIGTINVQNIPELDRENLKTPKKYKISDDNDVHYQQHVLQSLMHKLNNDRDIHTLQAFTELFDGNKLRYNAIAYFFKSIRKDGGDEANEQGYVRLYVYHLKKSGILKNKLNIFKKPKEDPIEGNDLMDMEKISEGFSLPVDHIDAISTYTEKKISSEKTIVTINVLHANKFDEIFNTHEIQKLYSKNVLEKFLNGKTTLSTDELKVELDTNVSQEDILAEISASDQLLMAFSSFRGTKRSTIQKTSMAQISEAFDYLRERLEVDADLWFTNDDIPQIRDHKIILTTRSVKIFTALLENKIIQNLLDQKIIIPYFD